MLAVTCASDLKLKERSDSDLVLWTEDLLAATVKPPIADHLDAPNDCCSTLTSEGNHLSVPNRLSHKC